jgi:hypothetical protein
MSSDEPKPKRKRGRPASQKPLWRRDSSAAPKYMPSEKVARKEVDMDLTFRRANQMC